MDEFGYGGEVAKASLFGDRTLVENMNLAKAFKERIQIELVTNACSSRSLGF
jgi:hypothetical protein